MLDYSVWSSYFVDLSSEEMIREFIRGGFRHTEFSDEHGAELLSRGDAEKEGMKLKRYADDLGFDFPQGHMLLKVDLCADDAVDTLKKWCDLFIALGIKAGVLHAAGGRGLDDAERFDRRVKALSALTDYIKGTGFVICLENLTGAGAPRTAEDLNAIIDAVGSDDNLGICLDTGHLNIIKNPEDTIQTQHDFILAAGSRLKALHIADNDTTSDMHLMPYGRGNIAWNEVMAALKETGYSGLFNMEIPGERRCPIEIRREKLIYCRKMCEYMLSL